MIAKEDFNPQCITYSQMNLIFNARVYYRRLTTWTRAYMLSRYFGVGTAEDLFGRLYLESLEIGDMLQIIFGRVYSEQYSQMVSQFPITLRDLISAQLSGNIEEINEHVETLYRNVADRAAFLEELNPYWSEENYIDLFNTYIQLILEEANALVAGDFGKEIEIFDRLTAHTNMMGDTFAQGLYEYMTSGQQTSDELPPEQCITFDQMNEIYNIRMFWFELVTWVRNYMLSVYRGLGNTPEVYDRLRQVPIDYVNRVERILGDGFAEDYIQLFNTYIDLIVAFVTAQKENNIDEINRVTQRLYQNADERAAFVASINPYWDEEDARIRLYNNLRATIDESTTFLSGDYARNIDIFSRLLDQAESISNWFAQGLFQYINAQKGQ